ncbi:glycerophosphodiester phosphodiesterase [Eubacterium sp. 1001713B170207_170306_E7]|uniref:glycerophosphodiester phosphodiesterase n=1 Tax=Eubacterium sp. 1001713B170207_170306_E7 TaxID=2787097 RepID=UPI0018988535|nr:glycerophosphodiester phosphodiesterase [Eubacterium sp. 1001713B170207_170306_E7]
MKPWNQGRGAFIRESLALLRFNFWTLAVFELIYKLGGTLAVLPLLNFGLRRLLILEGFPVISGDSVAAALKNPLVLLSVFVLLLLLAFYCIFEITVLALCFHESRNRRKVQMIPLLAAGFRQAVRIFNPRNYLAVLFFVVIMPVLHIGVTSDLVTELTVPGFILDYIKSSPVLYAAYTGLGVILLLVMALTLFAFNVFAVEGRNFIPACRRSIRLLKGRMLKTVGSFLLWTLLLLLVFGVLVLFLGALSLLSGTVVSLVTGRLEAGGGPPLGMMILIGILAVSVSAFNTVQTCLGTMMNYAFISRFYEAYSEEEGGEEVQARRIPEISVPFLKKRQLMVLALIMVMIAVGVKTGRIVTAFDADDLDTLLHGTQVSGHRGNSSDAPENSRSALEKAIELGADYVEIDVAETRDGVLVVSHDNNLKRTTGQNVYIWQSTYEEIRNLDIGSFFSPEYKGERLMTLDEAIEVCQGRIRMNIELKPTPYDSGFAQKAVETIKRHEFEGQCYLASLNYGILEEVKELTTEIETLYITPIAYGDIENLDVDALSIEQTFITKGLVERAHRKNKDVHAWTVDDAVSMQKMIDCGVDNIITDDVRTAITVTDENHPTREEILNNTLQQVIFGL